MSEENVSRTGRLVFSFWFQLILCIGIITVSVACGTYVWQVWRQYTFQTNAERLCIAYVEDFLKDRKDVNAVEAWLGQRDCVNRAMGRYPFETDQS